MRSDPQITVECDNPGCLDFVRVDAPFPYTHTTTDAAEDRAVTRAGWIVKDGHDYCSEECARESDDEDRAT